jgi:hypothetical protein
MKCAFVIVAVIAAACGPGSPGGPTMHNKINEEHEATSPVVSSDILARDPITNRASIKHILIGWKDVGDEDRRDPRAAQRSKHDAEDMVRELVAKLRGGADFDAAMKQYSEDPGSARAARAYDISPEASYVIEFKQLGLRLKVDEIGVVQSEFGFHIMKRVS